MITAAVILLLAITAALTASRLRRRRTHRLDWPRTVSYHKFNSLVNTYLLHHGWTINNLPIAQHVKIVRRAQDRVRVYCMADASEIDGSKVRDLIIEAVSQKPSLLVCVTSHEVADHLKITAAAGKVLITTYKDLAIFGSQSTGHFATFDAMRVAHLAKEPAAPTRKVSSP